MTEPGHQEPLAAGGGSGGCVERLVCSPPGDGRGAGASSGRPVEAGAVFVGPTSKTRAPAIFLEGPRGLVPPDQRALLPWLLWGLAGQLSVHSSPRSLGFEDGHWGALRARTPGRDPPRGPSGQPCPGGSRGGSLRSRTLAVLPRGALGPGLCLDSGNLLDACDGGPAPCSHAQVHRKHAFTQVRAQTCSPATRAQAQVGDGVPDTRPRRWDCEWSFSLLWAAQRGSRCSPSCLTGELPPCQAHRPLLRPGWVL